MSSEITPFSLEKHEQTGQQLKIILQQVQQLEPEMAKAYGKNGEQLTQKAVEALKGIQSFLDVKVFIEHPERDGNLNAAIYFGKGTKICSHEEGGGCKDCGHPHH